MNKTPKTLMIAAAFALLGGALQAAEHEVKMLNRGEAGAMVFEPALLKIAPGDTVTFVATDRSHNAETIAGMLPDGAEPFVGAMNKDVSYTFEQAGTYGIKCKPHYGMGMVGLIVVGDGAENRAAAEVVSHPGKAKGAFAAMFAASAD